MNAHSAENVSPVLLAEKSTPRDRINLGEEIREYLKRLTVVALGVFLGYIVAIIAALFLGWVGIC